MIHKQGSNGRKRAKRKRQASELACCGRLNVFLGLPLRSQVEVIAENEGRSLAYIVRLSVAALVGEYKKTRELPKLKAEEIKGKGPGRPRQFERVQ